MIVAQNAQLTKTAPAVIRISSAVLTTSCVWIVRQNQLSAPIAVLVLIAAMLTEVNVTRKLITSVDATKTKTAHRAIRKEPILVDIIRRIQKLSPPEKENTMEEKPI